MGAAEEALKRRIYQQERTGTVGISDFDAGVVTTAGAQLYEGDNGDQYVIPIPGVCPPPGLPGVPIFFAFPEDSIQKAVMPFVRVNRDDLVPAMERWQPGGIQYRTPGIGALPAQARFPNGMKLTGFDRLEELTQAIPYDITYTISILARQREAHGAVNRIFQHMLRFFQPYCEVKVKDSISDIRSYQAFNTGSPSLDNIGEVTERQIGYAITLRVEGELDLNDPITIQTVKAPLTLRTRKL